MRVTVLGDGAWGTAIAKLLAQNGHEVLLWCNDAEVALTIQDHHINERYLPGIQLPSTIIPTLDLSQALKNQFVFEAIPVKFMRSVLNKAKPYAQPGQTWVVLSKGIETDTLLLPSQIAQDVLGENVPTIIISGPSFAHDLIKQQLTAVAIAGSSVETVAPVANLLENNFFKTKFCPDIIGVQVGGALKNIIALGMGMLDGAGYKDNPQAFFLTQGLQEIAQVAQALGGNNETIYGLSGLGDLVLTATGKQSKNRALGRRLGQGESLSSLCGNGALPEGCNTLQSVRQLALKYELELPLCSGIYDVVFDGKPLDDVMKRLIKA